MSINIFSTPPIFDYGLNYKKAIFLINKGDLEGAKNIFINILKDDSKNVEILNQLALIYLRQGQFDRAIFYFEKAIKYKNDIFIFNNLANCYNSIGEFEKSVQIFNKAINLNKNFDGTYLNLATNLLARSEFQNAINYFIRAIILNPASSSAYLGVAYALYKIKNYKLSECYFKLSLEINSIDINSYLGLGNLYIDMDQIDNAIKLLNKALKLNNRSVLAYINLGFANHKLKRYEESLKAYDKCLEIENRHAECYNNRAHLLLDMNRPEDALSSVNKAIEFKEAYVQAYVNRGIIYHQLRLPQLSLESYDKALSIDNSFANAYYNKSLLQLSIGDFLDGFKNYQWRWLDAESSVTSGKRNFKEPLWLGGESLQNKTILIYTEQGLGDAIQFCRYIKNLAALGAKVIFEVPSSLFNLFRKLEGVNKLVIKNTESLVYDCQCPLQSLPHAFRTELNTIPCEIPYLFANSNQVANWEKKLGIKEKKRIGIVWSSHSTFKNDHNRSIRLNQFLKALPADKFDYFSLQKEVKDYDIEDLEQSNIKYFPNQLTDFSETAALIECMDLVISTCTSVAHLSGALGKPTWILLSHVPDWRWMYDRGDSPWYPSVKLIRQERPYSWDELLINLKNRLKSQE